MNGLDLVLMLAAVVAASGGWHLGFIRRLGGWIGFGTGVGVAVAVLPRFIEAVGLSDDRSVFLAGGALLILLATIGQGAGEAIGNRLRSEVDTESGQYLDSFGGSALGVVGVAALMWLLFPVMAHAQGWPASAARNSVIARGLAEALPTPPAQITAIQRTLAGGHFPTLFDRIKPAPDIPPPPPQSEFPRELYEQAMSSVVRVESPACGGIQSGSGFFVTPQWAVTNAHVVAGANRTEVVTTNGERHDATVIGFDPGRDLAVLSVASTRTPLAIATPEVNDRGLVMGFPGGGPFDPSPFMVAQKVKATGFDIYDTNRVLRDVLILSSDLAPGDSGSAVLRADGAVVGVAVAIAPDRPSVAYALNSSELKAMLDSTGGSRVSTGPCR